MEVGMIAVGFDCIYLKAGCYKCNQMMKSFKTMGYTPTGWTGVTSQMPNSKTFFTNFWRLNRKTNRGFCSREDL